MKKHRKCKKIIIAFVTVLFIAFVAVIGLHKTGIYRFDFLRDIYKKIDFQLSTNFLFMILSKKNIYFTRVIASCPLSQVWQNYLPLIMLWEK